MAILPQLACVQKVRQRDTGLTGGTPSVNFFVAKASQVIGEKCRILTFLVYMTHKNNGQGDYIVQAMMLIMSIKIDKICILD